MCAFPDYVGSLIPQCGALVLFASLEEVSPSVYSFHAGSENPEQICSIRQPTAQWKLIKKINGK